MSIYEAWMMGEDHSEIPEPPPPKKSDSCNIQIWIAGDLAAIKTCCRFFCVKAFCVTITPTTFIYTGGQEDGACVGIINYARFPESTESLLEKSMELANWLMDYCCQKSCSVVAPGQTFYLANPKFKDAR